MKGEKYCIILIKCTTAPIGAILLQIDIYTALCIIPAFHVPQQTITVRQG
jgi:hypothetical protein